MSRSNPFFNLTHHRCDTCGRFVSQMAPGVSTSQTWGYEMDGSPSLNDPTFRCSPCTDAHGIRPSNCHPPEHYMRRNSKAEAALRGRLLATLASMGLAHLTIHGLRAMAVCDRRIAGQTHQQIAAAIGMSFRQVEHYSQHIDQRLAAMSGRRGKG